MVLFNTKWNRIFQHFQLVYTVGVILEMCAAHNIDDTLKRHMRPVRWPCDTQESIVLCPNQILIHQELVSWPQIILKISSFTVACVASPPRAVCWKGWSGTDFVHQYNMANYNANLIFWRSRLNSLAPGKFEWNLRYVILKRILVINGWGIICEIVQIWMSLDFTDDQSTLVQVMAWCRQATSHYLSQCWPRSMSPYGVTKPQGDNLICITKSDVNFSIG